MMYPQFMRTYKRDIDPLLQIPPAPIRAGRLRISPVKEGDGQHLVDAVTDSVDMLYPWFHALMGTQEQETSVTWQEDVIRHNIDNFKFRERLVFFAWQHTEKYCGFR